MLKVKVSDLPDKGIRRQRQSDEIEQDLGIPMYFAHPYSPEERGSNEILNRYVRRFIPKERKIETVSAKELDQINHWINARPMKTLNWQSPRKVFQQFAVFGLILQSAICILEVIKERD